MNSSLQFYPLQSSMNTLPYQPLHQQPFQSNFHFQYDQQHLLQQSPVQMQLFQQLQHQQQYYQQQQYQQQLQPQFLQQQQVQQFVVDQNNQHVPIILNNNTQSTAPYGSLCFMYPQAMSNILFPKNSSAGDNLSLFCSAPTMKVLPRDNLSQTIQESSIKLIPSEIQVSLGNNNEIKLEQSKNHHDMSSSQLFHIKEESRISENSTPRISKSKTLLLQLPKQMSEESDQKIRTYSKTTQEMMVQIHPKSEFEPAEENREFKFQLKNEVNQNEDCLPNLSDSSEEIKHNEESIPASERKRVSKEKAATQKAENRKIKEKLLGMSSAAQKELLLQIQQVSKQNSAKAFLKAYKRFALGKQEYIYNYDISENQYYYKLCHDMPLVRIEDPSKKDLEGFYRKLKKFFQGKQYNNSTLKTVVRNKLYGQLFDDFLRTQSDEWLEHSKSKNKDDLRIIIKFLLLCHENTDYLIFLRDHDKSKEKKSSEDLSE